MPNVDDNRLDWAALDPLVFSGLKIEFLKRVVAATGLGLPEAIELLTSRYDALRASHPEGFSCSHEEYWRGFYS